MLSGEARRKQQNRNRVMHDLPVTASGSGSVKEQKRQIKIGERASDNGDDDRGGNLLESVDVDLVKHLKPRGFPEQNRSSQMFDFAVPSGSQHQDMFSDSRK